MLSQSVNLPVKHVVRGNNFSSQPLEIRVIAAESYKYLQRTTKAIQGRLQQLRCK